MNLQEFTSTKQHISRDNFRNGLVSEFSIEEGQSVIRYHGMYYIIKCAENESTKYRLFIGEDEYENDDLSVLELILYKYVNEI